MNLDRYDTTLAEIPSAKETSAMGERSQVDRSKATGLGVEYEESGSGPTLVLVPGSCSTGSS